MKWLWYSLAAGLISVIVGIAALKMLQFPADRAVQISVAKLEARGISTTIAPTVLKPRQEAQDVPPSTSEEVKTPAYFLSCQGRLDNEDPHRPWPMARGWYLAWHLGRLAEAEEREAQDMVRDYGALIEKLKAVAKSPQADPRLLAERVGFLRGGSPDRQEQADREASTWFKNLLLLDAYVAHKTGRNDDALASCGTAIDLDTHSRIFPMEGCQASWPGANPFTDVLPRILLKGGLADAALDDFSAVLSRRPGRDALERGLTDEMLLNKYLLENPGDPLMALQNYSFPSNIYRFAHGLAVFAPFRGYKLSYLLDVKADTIPLSRLPFHEARKGFDELLRKHASRVGRWALDRDRSFNVLYAEDEAQVVQARIAMAILRYRNSRGTYPETLQSLVPEYLSEIPVDPATGSAMGYAPTGATFVLYSAGEDVAYGLRLLPSVAPEGIETATGARVLPGDDWVWGYSAIEYYDYPFQK